MEELNNIMGKMTISSPKLLCKKCKKRNKIYFCNKNMYYNEHIISIIKIQIMWRRKIKKNQMFLDLLISNNTYTTNCKSNKAKDENSLSFLIIRPLSQSDCIKLGTGLEKIFYDIILNSTNLKDIKPKNKKGTQEKDHLFCDEDNKILYYAEFKSNINLDTEKSISTCNKCLNIVTHLNDEYPEYTIKWGLVGCRYISNNNIPKILKQKYKTIEKNLLGVNEYLYLLNTNIHFTNNNYFKFLNKVADTMFEKV